MSSFKSKEWKFLSFRYKNFIRLMIFVLIIVMVVGVLIYSDARSIMKTEQISSNEICAEQYQKITDSLFRNAELIMGYIYLDPNTNAFIDIPNPKSYEPDIYEQLYKLTKDYGYVSRYIYSIDIISGVNNLIYTTNSSVITNEHCVSTDEYRDKDLLKEIMLMKADEFTAYFHMYNNSYPYLISLIKKSKEGTGAVVINLNAQLIGNEFAESFRPDLCLIVSQNENIIFSPNQQEISGSIRNSKYVSSFQLSNYVVGNSLITSRAIMSSKSSQYYPWYYISFRDRSSDIIPINRLKFLILIVFTCLLIGLFFSFIVSKNLSRPIQKIVTMLESNSLLKSDEFDSNETRFIAQKMAGVISSNAELRNSLEKNISNLNEMQNMALQLQINPHFLFNTLNLINLYIIDTNGTNHESSRLITWLSELLRYSLKTDSTLVSINDEIEKVKTYTKILEIRHPGMFTVEYDIPEELNKHSILKLSLQPLVENAVYHGIQPKGNGHIHISASTQNNHVVIGVSDDGIGMNESELKALRENLQKRGAIDRTSHLGLLNVHERISLIFGDQYGVEVYQNSIGGLLVIMRYPK